MQYRSLAVASAAIALACGQAAPAQDFRVLQIPYGGGSAPGVPQDVADPDATAEEIADDAARDLKDRSYYNRPGATLEDYNADWQTCRLIARGSRTPSGMATYVYNPAFVSPLAAGIGSGIGAGLGALIAEGVQRRANRRACLLIKGWRLVRMTDAEQRQVAAMSPAGQQAFFAKAVGAENPSGEIEERTSFVLAPDPELDLDAPVAGEPSLWLGKSKISPTSPIVLGPNEGAVVLAFRRPDAKSAGRSGKLRLLKFKAERLDLDLPRKGVKEDKQISFVRLVESKDRKAPYELQVVRLTPGYYVIDSTSAGSTLPMTTNCFGAPIFEVKAGETVYLGDWIPFMDVRLSNGDKLFGTLAFAPHFDQASSALARFQPALTESMTPAALANGATYSCAGMTMDRSELPGIAAMELALAKEPAGDAGDQAETNMPVGTADEAGSTATEVEVAEESGSAV